MFSIQERRKNRHKFGGTKVCKAEKVRQQFLNSKIEVQVFSYIICSLAFKNISCTLFLLHMKTMNRVVSCFQVPRWSFKGELLYLHLAINVTGLVEPTEPGSVWEIFQLHLTSCLFELLGAEYLRETNISIYISHLLLFVLQMP